MILNSLQYDVVVAGGGAAGIAAAIGASRSGLRVALLENHSYLGGKATTSHVGTVCGLYLRNENHHLGYAMNGFAREFEERLRMKTRSAPSCHKKGLWYLPYNPFDFIRLCDELVRENNIDVYFHSDICGVEISGEKISRLNAFVYDRLVYLEPGVVIDCTGEAIISKLGQQLTVECDEYQSSAQVFTMEMVEETDTSVLTMSLIREIKKSRFTEQADESMEHISIVPGSHRGSQVSIKVGIPAMVTGDLNKISALEILGRMMIEKVAVFLTAHVSAFKNARIGSIAPEIGVRTGRRSVGKKELSLHDVLNCIKNQDGIANGSWPIEQWSLNNQVQMQYFAEDDYYQISAACLESASIRNLYFAGRHISASTEAIASARVIGTCLSTGYAAGKLSAGYLEKKERNETIKLIRHEQVIL